MPFSYDPLWKLLKAKKLTQKDFAKQSGVSISTLTRMRRGEYVALKVLDVICTELHCGPAAVMDHIRLPPETPNVNR